MNGKFIHTNHIVQVKRLYSKSKLHHLWWPTRWWKLLILYLERIQIFWVSKQSQGYISIRSKCQYSSRDTFICESSSSSINKSSCQVVVVTGWNKAAMFHRDWEIRTCTLLFLTFFSALLFDNHERYRTTTYSQPSNYPLSKAGWCNARSVRQKHKVHDARHSLLTLRM